MPDGLPRRIVRAVPIVGPLARRARRIIRSSELIEARDAKIGRLRRQVRREETARRRAEEKLAVAGAEQLERPRPSFRRNLLELRRTVDALRPLDPGVLHPVLQIPRKLRNYRLAASHGIAVPEILGVWATEQDIDLTQLPDEFVLKSDVGAGGNGVFPLRRVEEDRYAVIGGDEILTTADLQERYHARRSTGAPFFAEAFLQQRVPTEQIPDDVKIFAHYGEVTMVLLRQMPVHANLDHARYRYTDAQGRDLGDDIAPGRNISSAVPAPEPLADFVRVAEHLSRAVALPFIRVDIYDTVDGPVLGELTRAPGGPQRYRRDHDIAMGTAWDKARWRLDLDVLDGRPLRNLHGLHPVTNFYPEGHISRREDSKGWQVVTADCAQWCFAGHLPRSRD